MIAAQLGCIGGQRGAVCFGFCWRGIVPPPALLAWGAHDKSPRTFPLVNIGLAAPSGPFDVRATLDVSLVLVCSPALVLGGALGGAGKLVVIGELAGAVSYTIYISAGRHVWPDASVARKDDVISACADVYCGIVAGYVLFYWAVLRFHDEPVRRFLLPMRVPARVERRLNRLWQNRLVQGGRAGAALYLSSGTRIA